MAAPSPSRPGRTLLALFAVLAILIGAVALTATKDDGGWTPKLGLDLVGGQSLTLTARTDNGQAVTDTALNEAVSIIRKRVDGFGVSEAEVSKLNSTNIVISVPGTQNREILERAKQAAALNFRLVLGTATSGAPAATPTTTPVPSGSATPATSGTATPKASGSSVAPTAAVGTPSGTATTQGRVAPAGLKAVDATPAPTTAAPATPAPATTAPTTAAPTTPAPSPAASAAPVATPAISPTDSLADVQAKVPAAVQEAFTNLDCADPAKRGGGADVPGDFVAVCADEANDFTKYLLAPAVVLGKEITEANSGLQANSQGASTGAWVVNVNFDGSGTRKWASFTQVHSGAGEQVAVVLDNKVVSAPQLNGAIPNGQTEISGSFTQASATDLANVLKYGALPLTFVTGTEQTISASLGEKQLKGGLLAGLIGLILVVLYSLLYYRGLGLVNVISLIISAAFTYFSIVLLSNMIGLRLSLSGVAGLVIGIGIAADSFIVYFERLRDEMREGKTMRVAVEVGWRRARRTVVAADFVSFLAAVVLYVLSVGAVKGFAVTLGLTTIIDILVVFMFTKPVVTLLARTKFYANGHRLSGLAGDHIGGKAEKAPRRTSPGLATRTTEQEA